jgi:hypothetical protein
LLDLVRTHVAQFGKSLTRKKVIVLVHPLYLLVGPGYIRPVSEGKWMNEVVEFYNSLARVLARKGSQRKNVVLFETPQHYARFSSSLVESGLIDSVFFTHYDLGDFIDVSDISDLSEREIYAGGMFNRLCYSDALSHVSGVTPRERIHPIRGLVLNSPGLLSSGCQPLLARTMYLGDSRVASSQTVTLDEILGSRP